MNDLHEITPPPPTTPPVEPAARPLGSEPALTPPPAPTGAVTGRIALVTPSVAYEQRIQQAFGGRLDGNLRHWRVTDEPLVLERILEDEPHAVVLGPEVDEASAFDAAGRIDRDHPDVTVVLVADPTSRVLEQALRAGIRDVLPLRATDAEVAATLTRAVEVAQRRRRTMTAAADSGPAHRVLTVVSPKGGAGKTMLATNLAVGLAAEHPGEVVLADLDLRFGDVASALQLVPEHGVAEAAAASSRGDAMALKVFLTPYGRDLFVLAAPESPTEVDHVTGRQVTDVIRLLSEAFPYVVVDTAAGLEEHAVSAVEVATDLLLVCPLDVAGIRSLTKELAVLDDLGVQARRHLIVNRADSKVGIDLADVEATVGLPPRVSIPSSRAVPFAMNQGIPVLEAEPRSAVSKAIQGLVAEISPATAAVDGSWLKRLWS